MSFLRSTPFSFLNSASEVIDDSEVEILPAQRRIAVGRLDFEKSVVDLEDRDVEGAASEVVDRDGLVALLVQSVGESRGGRLVDDAADFEAGNLAGILCGLALRVV